MQFPNRTLLIRLAIERALEQNLAQMIIYADLDNFKAYNDTYGFAKGDEIITFTAKILTDSLALATGTDNFLGHIGGDDFVLFINSADAEAVVIYILEKFDAGIKEFYSAEHLEAGGIKCQNRQGQEISFPLLSISLGGVDFAKAPYDYFLDVSDACSQVKKKAK